jgi:hypothetical protein
MERRVAFKELIGPKSGGGLTGLHMFQRELKCYHSHCEVRRVMCLYGRAMLPVSFRFSIDQTQTRLHRPYKER